ncbi:hypothetical protein [Streptomyces hydrogenans]|uniref:hypothetical protein n=1 Tax=Streptomyces hydrogenans TaxID=1873719 RepID=UPI0036E1B429
MAQSSGLRGHQQPPLSFVQVWEQHRELHSKLITNLVRDAHTTPTSPSSESNTLMIGRPLGAPVDVETLTRRAIELEQQILDLRAELAERDKDLTAARAASRELMGQLNR